MIPAHLYNVPTLHHAFEFQLLRNNVAARLLQGCHKVETVSNPKLFQGCGQVVTTLCNNLVTRLPHPCHKVATPLSQGCHTLVTSLEFLYGNVDNVIITGMCLCCFIWFMNCLFGVINKAISTIIVYTHIILYVV